MASLAAASPITPLLGTSITPSSGSMSMSSSGNHLMANTELNLSATSSFLAYAVASSVPSPTLSALPQVQSLTVSPTNTALLSSSNYMNVVDVSNTNPTTPGSNQESTKISPMEIDTVGESVKPSAEEKENIQVSTKQVDHHASHVVTMNSLDEQSNSSLSQSSLIIVETSVKSEDSIDSFASSSSSNTGDTPTKKRRRRGEDQRLLEDLKSINSDLANSLIKNGDSAQTPTKNDSSDVTLTDSPSAKCATENDASSSAKASKSSPAFHLRPRRSHRSSFGGSGSSSPIYYLSPVKKTPRPAKLSQYTQQLLSDTTRRLSTILNGDDVNNNNVAPNGQPTVTYSDHKPVPDLPQSLGVYKEKTSISLLVDGVSRLASVEPKSVISKSTRSPHRSIVRDVDISVFAEFISPNKLFSSVEYGANYVSMRIVDHAPLEHFKLVTSRGDSARIPFVRLTAVDIEDRFQLEHAQGVFDCDK